MTTETHRTPTAHLAGAPIEARKRRMKGVVVW